MNGRPYCTFCGRHADDCPGGLWHLNFGRPRHAGDPGICRYCARQALRAIGDASEAPSAEPIPIFARRPAAGPDTAA